MERTTYWVGLALGFCAFGLTWATVRHFTGLAEESGSALAVAIVSGLVVGAGYIAIESRLFDIFRRRGHR